MRLLIWVLSLDKQPFRKFQKRILRIWAHNGTTFLVLYLKEAFLITQHFLAGNPKYVTDVLPITIVDGLPGLIPGPLRLRMKAKDSVVIRGVLTVLQVYRVLTIPGKLKLETITDPFKGKSSSLPL